MIKFLEIAKETSNGHLDAIVVSHRHKDHLSGFATKKDGKGSGDIIAELKPDRVIQPWTEHPEAERDANFPPEERADNQLHISGLHQAPRFIDSLDAFLKQPNNYFNNSEHKSLVEEIRFLGETNISNKSAVQNLMKMGQVTKTSYVFFGSDSGLKEILPGVSVRVLGPPTLKQSDEIRKQC
jgi:metal-dependent hydrolase (beta-lactamase superfamily II)